MMASAFHKITELEGAVMSAGRYLAIATFVVFAVFPGAAFSQAQGSSCNALNKIYSPTWFGHADNQTYICDGALLQILSTATASPLQLGFAGSVGIGTNTPASSLDLSLETDAVALPSGTVAQRPASPLNGEIRYNSSTPGIEAYYSGAWNALGGGGGGGTITLGTSASVTNPQRSGQVGTGLFSATSNTVSITENSIDVADFASGGLNLPVATESYQINGNNAIWQDNTNANTAIGDTTLPTTISQAGGGTNGQGNFAAGWEALNINTTGYANTAVGANTLAANTTGLENTAVGVGALGLNTTGQANTAVGFLVLYTNTSGIENAAVGDEALFSNTSGSYNVAMGMQALDDNTTGSYNTALGTNALASNVTGSENVAVGDEALYTANGSNEVAVGGFALQNDTGGNSNTAVGLQALNANTTGGYNTAVGQWALVDNTTGGSNTAMGYSALNANTTGAGNTALGNNALNNNTTGVSNTAVGYHTLGLNTIGTNNTALGYDVGSTTLTTGTDNILIGVDSSTDTPASSTSNFLNIGNAIYATNLQNNTNTGGAAAVGIGTNAPPAELTVGPSASAMPSTFSAVGTLFVIDGAASQWTGMDIISPNAEGTYINFGDASTENLGNISYNDSSNTFQITTGTNNGLVINSSGFVGIGTATPGSILEVDFPANGSGASVFSIRGTTYGNSILTINNWGAMSFLGAGSSYDFNVKGRADFVGDSNNPANFSAQFSGANGQTGNLIQAVNYSGTNVFNVNPNGSVGIGTATPSEALDVYSGHLLARGGSTPTTFSGCGTSPSASGSDNSFLLTYGAGTPTAACTITFGTAWTTAPKSCVLTPGLAATAAVMQTDQVFVSSISTTKLVISSTTSLPASSKLYVQCM